MLITPDMIWAVFIGFCGSIATIGGAAAVISRWHDQAIAPDKKQDERLADIEFRLAEHDKYFAKDKHRLDSLEEGNRVTQHALLALLAHGIDGNAIDDMREAKDALQKFLISR